MSTDSENNSGSEDGYTTEEDEAIVELVAAAVRRNGPTRAPRRVPRQSGMEWVMETMANPEQCHNMFRMRSDQIHALYNLLVNSYHLTGTYEVCPMEAIGMFLYAMAGGYSMRSVNNRMVRCNATVNRYFHRVLNAVNEMAADIIKPVDPNSFPQHYRLQQEPVFEPFRDAVGAVDGTHIPVMVRRTSSIVHRNRHNETSKNVLTVIGWDERVMFVDVGWPGSVHDQRVLSEAVRCYPLAFPRLPWG